VHLGLLALLAMAAVPSSRAPLRLVFESCADIDQATVSRVVSMELEAALADEGQGDVLTTAQAECADGRVRLTIDDPVTGKSTTRTVDLAGQPRGLRSRLLGLAISEAVLASWIELKLRPEPTPPPDAAASPEVRREAAHITERRLQVTSQARVSGAWEIVAGPATRWFASGVLTFGLAGGARHWFDNHPLAGVGLELDASYGDHLVTEAVVVAEDGKEDEKVDEKVLVHGTAAGFSFGPCLLMRSSFSRIVVTAGAGARLALARLSAEPVGLRVGGAGWRGWTGPFLAADVSVPLSDSLFLRAGVEIGYVLVPARGRLGKSKESRGAVLSLATKL
jgi:hypothetical protein